MFRLCGIQSRLIFLSSLFSLISFCSFSLLSSLLSLPPHSLSITLFSLSQEQCVECKALIANPVRFCKKDINHLSDCTDFHHQQTMCLPCLGAACLLSLLVVVVVVATLHSIFILTGAGSFQCGIPGAITSTYTSIFLEPGKFVRLTGAPGWWLVVTIGKMAEQEDFTVAVLHQSTKFYTCCLRQISEIGEDETQRCFTPAHLKRYFKDRIYKGR